MGLTSAMAKNTFYEEVHNERIGTKESFLGRARMSRGFLRLKFGNGAKALLLYGPLPLGQGGYDLAGYREHAVLKHGCGAHALL